MQDKNLYVKTIRILSALRYLDVVLIAIYACFSSHAMSALMYVYDNLILTPDCEKFRFLMWSGMLFFICAACSFSRRASINNSKGIVFIELMVLVAVIASVLEAINEPTIIDPWWITRVNYFSYCFEILITAGAGYIFSDFLSRFILIFLPK